MKGELRGWAKKVKGLRSTDWYFLANSHGAVKYSIGNMLTNIVMTMYGVRWVLGFWGDQFVSYINV